MKTALRLFALTIGLLAGTAGVHEPSRAAAPGERTCVAVLEPEVLDDLPQHDRKALAGWLDALLAESLAGREGFVAVDRQGLDRVLAEKSLEGSGAARVAAGEVAAPLRRFWSAGVLLTPRQAVSTKEERLLRLMGLSARKGGDAAAALAPAPDARLTFELDEQIAEGLAVDKTPVVLKLAWSAGRSEPVTWSARGVAGQWNALRARALEWVRGRRAGLSSAAAAGGEEAARQMARQELDLARRWQGLRFSASSLAAVLERPRREAGGNAPPWDLVEVFFQVRSKDWRKVRAAYQRLASKYDESVRRIWRYNETPLLPHTLRAARDPEWSTWRPEFAKGLAREIRQQDFQYTINLVWPAFLDAAPNGPRLPAEVMAGLDVAAAAEDVLAERKPLVLLGRRLWRIEGSALAELSPKTLRPVAGAIGGTAQWDYLPGESKAGAMTFGSLFWRRSRTAATYDWPVVEIRTAAAWQDRIVMVLGTSFSESVLAFYRPAPAGSTDWAAEDQWAFYWAPEKSVVHSLHAGADGALWLSTTAGLLRLNEAELPSLATTFPDSVKSTRQWRDGWQGQQDQLWKRDVVVCIARRQWDKALQRIDRHARNESAWRMSDDLKKWERLAIPFWRARVYAEQPGTADKALTIYASLAADRNAPDAVRLLARICQVLVLHQARRWPELVRAYDAATAAFPQLRVRGGREFDTLAPLVDQARRELSKGRAAPPEKP